MHATFECIQEKEKRQRAKERKKENKQRDEQAAKEAAAQAIADKERADAANVSSNNFALSTALTV
jgi:hypothetical protein